MTNHDGTSTKTLVSLRDYVELLNKEQNNNIKDLKDYFNMRFESADRMVTAALTSADRAVSKAENASEKRFEGVNEFRATLSDQARNFLTRAEFDAKWENIEKNRKDNTSLIIAVLGIIIAVISLIVKLT